jgi:hypothetical protein
MDDTHTHLMLMGHRKEVGTSAKLLTSRFAPDTSRGGRIEPAAAALPPLLLLLLRTCCLASSCPSTSSLRMRTLSAVLGVVSVLYHRLSACVLNAGTGKAQKQHANVRVNAWQSQQAAALPQYKSCGQRGKTAT